MALGGVTVGSLQIYLPFLVDQISSQQASPKHQYLLLKALNEVRERPGILFYGNFSILRVAAVELTTAAAATVDAAAPAAAVSCCCC
jgi:hypothetical protein